MDERLGLIAGNRRFPLLVAQCAKKKGISVIAVAVKNETSFLLKNFVEKIYWLALGDFLSVCEIFRREGVSKVMMAGQISPSRLFSKEVQQNSALQSLLKNIKDKRADSIFGAFAQELGARGLTLLDSTELVKEYLPKKGVLTNSEPSSETKEDVRFGQELAKAIGALDIGQAVAVKSKAIIAVEALEGTDNLIKRAGSLSHGGFTLVKVSKPKQDKRFDIPVVGLTTVKNLVRAKAKCLAIEAQETLFLDREKGVQLANKHAMAIVAI